MTKILEKAFKKAYSLPVKEQDVIGAFMLEEIESESKWDVFFEKSQDKLAKLANEALSELKAGKTEPIE